MINRKTYIQPRTELVITENLMEETISVGDPDQPLDAKHYEDDTDEDVAFSSWETTSYPSVWEDE